MRSGGEDTARLGGVLIVLAALVGLVIAVNVMPDDSQPARSSSMKRGGPQVSVLRIVAGPGISYDRTEYKVRAGVVEVHLTGAPGLGLIFGDKDLRDCRLFTTGPTVCKVALTPGRYRVFDGIASHRTAGLEATIVAKPT